MSKNKCCNFRRKNKKFFQWVKKCFCFCYYRRKNWKKFRSIKYYRPRGGVGAFQVIYITNIIRLFCIVLIPASPCIERIIKRHLSNMFYIYRMCSTSVEYVPTNPTESCLLYSYQHSGRTYNHYNRYNPTAILTVTTCHFGRT